MPKFKKYRRYFRAARVLSLALAPSRRAPLDISVDAAIPVTLKYLHRRRGDFVSRADVLRALSRHFVCAPHDVRPIYDAVIDGAMRVDSAVQRRATGVRWAPQKAITLTYLLERLAISRIALPQTMPGKRWAQVLDCWPEDVAYATEFFRREGTGMALARVITQEIVAQVRDTPPRGGGDVTWWVRRTACAPFEIDRAVRLGWLVPGTADASRFTLAPRVAPLLTPTPASSRVDGRTKRGASPQWLLAIARQMPRHNDATRANQARAWLDANLRDFGDPALRAHLIDVGAYLENPAKTLRPVLESPLYGELTPRVTPASSRGASPQWLLAIARQMTRHTDEVRITAARAWLESNVRASIDPALRAQLIDVGAYLENPVKTLRPVLESPLYGELTPCVTPASSRVDGRPRPRGASPKWLLAIARKMPRHTDEVRITAARAWLDANLRDFGDSALRAHLIDVGAGLENPAKTLRALCVMPAVGALPPYEAPVKALPCDVDAIAQRLLRLEPAATFMQPREDTIARMRMWLEHNLTAAFIDPDLRETLIARFAHASYPRLRAFRAPLTVYPRWRLPPKDAEAPKALRTPAAYVLHLNSQTRPLGGATWRKHFASTPEIDAWIRDALTVAVAAVTIDASLVAPYVDRYWRGVDPTPYSVHRATRYLPEHLRTSPWTPYVGPLADVAAFARCATLRAGRLVTPDEAPTIASLAWEPRRGFQWAAQLHAAPSCPEFDAWITEALMPRPRMPQ